MTAAPAGRLAGRLAGRRALITGGSRGIGLGIARAFAAEGASLVLAATDPARLAAAREALAATGAQVETRVCDVADRAACFALVEDARRALGGLDVLVNCAGIHKAGRFLDHAPEDFARIMAVNLHGPVHLMQAALPGMIEAGYGKVINVASTAGKWASANQSAYNASKHALVGLTRCVALETGRGGVCVNAICPGMVDTDLVDDFLPGHAAATGTTPEAVRAGLEARIALGRFLKPPEIGHLAVYLASAESDGMTGQSILLDGGMLFV